MSQSFVVSSSDAGSRLDQWLMRRLSGKSRAFIKQLVDNGCLRVNQRRVTIAGWRLNAQDRVEVQSREEQRQHVKAHVKRAYLDVLFEDRDLLVINKPAAVHTVDAPGGPAHHTVVEMARAYLRRKYRESVGSYITPLHRLDVGTSGVIAIACSHAGERLASQFERHTITRRYVALVDGAIDEEDGVIDFALEKGTFPEGRKTRIVPKGKGLSAKTRFRVRERYRDATLLDIAVETGRTHQIRAHLSAIGHPIIGDQIYGGSVRCRRPALHAALLAFRHPVTGKRIECEAPLPADMRQLVDHLRGG